MNTTSNLFIAQQCDQAGELIECINSGQVSAAQIEAHRVAGDLVNRVSWDANGVRTFNGVRDPAACSEKD